jgi:mannose-1-phosphate guanylyltransferase
MFQHALDRLAPLFLPAQIFVVTRQDQRELLSSQAPELPAANFIKQPFGRGTEPAIGLAATLSGRAKNSTRIIPLYLMENDPSPPSE